MSSSLAARLWRGFLLGLVILVVVVHVAAGWVFADRIVAEGFVPSPGSTFGDPDATSLAIEEVTYEAPVGEMDAWFVPGTRSQWVVHVHGKGASLEEAIPTAEALASAGYPQLIIGYRNDPGQPSDPSGYYRYGATEWADLAAAVEWAVDRGADDVALVGYSTGGAIALSFLYRTPQAPVRSLVMDAPNADMEATIDYAGSQEDLVAGIPLPFTVAEIAKTVAALRASINWEALDYVRRLDALGVPTLVFHGSDDLTVPLETSRAISEARPDLVQLVVVDGAGHVESRTADPAGYDQRILAFLASNWR